MPKENELPDDLKPLVRRHGVHLRHETFIEDAERLIRGLNLKAPRARATLGKPEVGGNGWISSTIALGVFVMAATGATAWLTDFSGIRSGTLQSEANPSTEAFPLTAPTDSAAPNITSLQTDAVLPSPAMTAPKTPDELAAVAWNEINLRDPASLRQFLKDYGTSTEAVKARLALDRLDADYWAEAVTTDTSSSYNSYLAAFPQGTAPPGSRANDAAARIKALATPPKPTSPPKTTAPTPSTSARKSSVETPANTSPASPLRAAPRATQTVTQVSSTSSVATDSGPQRWELGMPDVIIQFPRFQISATGSTSEQSASVAHSIGEDRWVTAIAIQPGLSGVLRSAEIGITTNGGGKWTPWASYKQGGSKEFWRPSNGSAVFLPADAKLVLRIKYEPIGREIVNEVRLGLYLIPRGQTPTKAERLVEM